MPQSTRQTSNVASANVLLICDEDSLSASQRHVYTEHEAKLEAYNKAVEVYSKMYGHSSFSNTTVASGTLTATPPLSSKGNNIIQNGITTLQQQQPQPKPQQPKPQQPKLQQPKPQQPPILVPVPSVKKAIVPSVTWQPQTQLVARTVTQSIIPIASNMIKTQAAPHLVSTVNTSGQKTIIQVPAGTELTGMQVVSVPVSSGGYQLVMSQASSLSRIGPSVIPAGTIAVVNNNRLPVPVKNVAMPVPVSNRGATSTAGQVVMTKVMSNPVSQPVIISAADVPTTNTITQQSGNLKRTATADDSSSSSKRMKTYSVSIQQNVEENHYGFKQGRAWWDDEKPKGSFRCYVCNKKLSTNIRYMQHIKHHLDNEQQLNSSVNNLVNCRSCYKHFNTPFQLQSHVEKAHMYCKHRCGICEVACSDNASLVQHLTKNHPSLQMPYVCGVCNYMTSFYDDLVSHFSKQHEGSKALMCPFCVRIIKCNNSFLRHCKTHLSVSMKNGLFRCRSCKLMFLNSTMLKEHTQKDHVTYSLKERTGVPQLSPNRGKQAINIAAVKVTPVVKYPIIKVSHSLWTRKEIIRPKGALRCFECGTMTHSSKDHFRKKMSCNRCKYTTYCGMAFANHMITFHKAGSAPKIHLIRKTIVNNGRMLLGCKRCEFSTLSPTLMACHIESCPRGQTIIESFKVRTSSLQASRHFKRDMITIDNSKMTTKEKKKQDDDDDNDDDDVIVIEDEVLVDLTDDVPSTSKEADTRNPNEKEPVKTATSIPVKIGKLSVKLEKLPDGLTAINTQGNKNETTEASLNKTGGASNQEPSTETSSHNEEMEVDVPDKERSTAREKTHQDSANGDSDNQPVNGDDKDASEDSSKVIKFKEVQIKLEQIKAL